MRKRSGKLDWTCAFDEWTAFGPGDSEFRIEPYDDYGRVEACAFNYEGDYIGKWQFEDEKEAKEFCEKYYSMNPLVFEAHRKRAYHKKAWDTEYIVNGWPVDDFGDGSFRFGGEPEISWSSVGRVSIQEAREFAEYILAVCDEMELDPETTAFM